MKEIPGAQTSPSLKDTATQVFPFATDIANICKEVSSLFSCP